ncbi:hypothetical protein LIER_14213 [Lithospermum erythrorhizon]|uniref:Uncharacterized protein n=1 Tax=Lithospermum erythrorhizon TaxID=34254 RepID=A0AAV3Q2X7_LITER
MWKDPQDFHEMMCFFSNLGSSMDKCHDVHHVSNIHRLSRPQCSEFRKNVLDRRRNFSSSPSAAFRESSPRMVPASVLLHRLLLQVWVLESFKRCLIKRGSLPSFLPVNFNPLA